VQSALLALTVSLETLRAVKGRVLRAMREGLGRQTHAQASVRMLPTYVCSTPDGTGKMAQPRQRLLCTGLQPVMGSVRRPCAASASPRRRAEARSRVPQPFTVVSGPRG